MPRFLKIDNLRKSPAHLLLVFAFLGEYHTSAQPDVVHFLGKLLLILLVGSAISIIGSGLMARTKWTGLLVITMSSFCGYALPALISWTIFAPLDLEPFSLISLLLIVVWLLPRGMRCQLCTQFDDLDQDRAAGNRTFAVRHGRTWTLRLAVVVFLPIELLAMLLALMVISWPWPVPVLGLLIFAAWEWRVVSKQWIQPMPAPTRWRRIEWSDLLGSRLLDFYVQTLLPPLALALLLGRFPALWPTVLLYVLLAGRSLLAWFSEVRLIISTRFRPEHAMNNVV